MRTQSGRSPTAGDVKHPRLVGRLRLGASDQAREDAWAIRVALVYVNLVGVMPSSEAVYMTGWTGPSTSR